MTLKKAILGAALGAGALMFGAGSASAYVVCNHEGDCWHTESRYKYPDRGYEYHPDDWYFHHHFERDRFRDYHEGRGYWRNNVWVTF